MIFNTDTDTNEMDFSVLPNIPISPDPQSQTLGYTPQTINDVPIAENISNLTLVNIY